MKKAFFLAFAFACILAGCENSENKSEYKVYVYGKDLSLVNRGDYRAEENELYKFVHGGINEIVAQCDEQAFDDETQAVAMYDDAVGQMKALCEKVNGVIESGHDFGASEFSIEGYSIVLKDGVEMKKSESCMFEYKSNLRIESPQEIKINTQFSESCSGIEPVIVADIKINVRITGWKLYNENGELSTSKIINKVEVSEGAVGETIFDVSFSAQKGVDAGKFYILVTYEDEDKSVFDLMINVTHTTKAAE